MGLVHPSGSDVLACRRRGDARAAVTINRALLQDDAARVSVAKRTRLVGNPWAAIAPYRRLRYQEVEVSDQRFSAPLRI